MSVGKIVSFSSLAPEIQELIREAVAARQLAYCPYSKFQVGASLLCDDHSIVTGCNVETSTRGENICAERTAFVKAVSSGKRKFKAIVVTAYFEEVHVSPCGSCRQFILEFGENTVIYLAKSDFSTVLITNIKELLPLSYHRLNVSTKKPD